MAAISGIDTGYSITSLTSSKTEDVSMGKEDFLTLLVAQLQNQDPMNPSDATEFTAQLAQFSQLEQLTNVNSSLEGLATMSSEMQRMSALGLIGQDVVAQADEFDFNGESVELGYRLDSPAEDVKLYVLGSSGATLATLTAQDTSAGEHFFSWDGTTDTGMPLVAGHYSLVARAVDADEALLNCQTLVQGQVSAVDLSAEPAQLETTAGTFSISKVDKAGAVL